MDFILAPLVFIIFLGIYFLPSIVAYSRQHPSWIGIFILNFFLGWSLIGWVAALAWAFSDVRVFFVQGGKTGSDRALGDAEALEKLAELKDRGVITEAEFEAKKRRILED